MPGSVDNNAAFRVISHISYNNSKNGKEGNTLILTAEEYARGFIDFDAVLPQVCTVELWTRTADGPEDEGE